jgi:hypothetical protein
MRKAKKHHIEVKKEVLPPEFPQKKLMKKTRVQLISVQEVSRDESSIIDD